jgi:hypothetical protein
MLYVPTPRPSDKTRNSRKGAHAPKCYAVCDGRVARGIIAVAGTSYTAIATDGEVIGAYPTMRQAMGAFGEVVS